MATRAPDDFDGLTGRPRLVEVTLLTEPGARGRLQRSVGTCARVIVATALVAAMGVLVIGTLAGGRHRAARAEAAASVGQHNSRAPAELPGARDSGPAGVAAAYGFPLRCLSVTIAPANHSYARADFNRASLCGRYDGDVTAVFRRLDHIWRPVLDTTSYSCPVASLSSAVQSELDICP